MPEWIKELLVAMGGGATVVIAIFVFLKSIVVKIVDKAIDTSFEKSTIKFSNKLERTTKAYEVLLRKEFDYYEKIDPYMATLVPLVQDLVFWTEKFQNKDSENVKEQYREHLLKYLKIVPELKNDNIMFQPYVPENIDEAVSKLLENMQSDIEYLTFVGEVMYCKNTGDIDLSKMNEISENVLISVALVETLIKKRLTELSSN